jgi:hypothetical protein
MTQATCREPWEARASHSVKKWLVSILTTLAVVCETAALTVPRLARVKDHLIRCQIRLPEVVAASGGEVINVRNFVAEVIFLDGDHFRLPLAQ